MPYNHALEKRIDDLLPETGPDKKKMFGGVCYLFNGNMAFGIWRDYLIVRMGRDLAAEKLKQKHVRPFDLTGKPMRGWVMVGKGSWHQRDELTGWLDAGRLFALSLPAKSPGRRSLEEIYYRSQR